MEAKKYIDKFLKENKILFSVDFDEKIAFYELSLGSFPLYIQYEMNSGNDEDESLQIWAREDENSDLDLFHNDIMTDCSLSESDVESILDDSISQYKELIKAVGKINSKVDEILGIARHKQLSKYVLDTIVNQKLDEYEE